MLSKSLPLHDFFFGATACRIFFSDKFPLDEFFGGIVTYPPIISNGPPLKKGLMREILKSTPEL